MSHFSFTYSGQHNDSFDSRDLDSQFPSNVSLTKSFDISDDTTWTVVLREFCSFLSGVYGYDVGDSVVVKRFDGEVPVKEADNF